MADTDILQAIQIIDDKIASLQKARDQLANAFGIDGKSHTPHGDTLPRNGGSNAAPQRSVPGHEPSGRKVELALFLLAHGPTSRATIIEQSGLPEGTISYCLNDKRFFHQTADGNWAITEYSRRGLERGSKTGTFQSEQN